MPARLETTLGYRFANQALLDEALTHPGAAETANGMPFNYQRLEFLGDAVLGLLVAELLLELYPKENEGSIARRQAALVCSQTLLDVATQWNLADYLHGDLTETSDMAKHMTGLDDACEAILGAIYLDAGLDRVRPLVRRYWEPLARKITSPPKDAKTALQEWAQGRGLGLPIYTVQEQAGLAHAPVFTTEVQVMGHPPAIGTGPSKRIAEQAAAKTLLTALENTL